MNKLKKIGEGAWTVYLYECPSCGSERTLDEEKATTMGTLAVIGSASSLMFGAPVAGLLGGIGLAKLALAGTISGAAAVNAIRANYKLIGDMNKRSFFTCPHCGCADIVRLDEIAVALKQMKTECEGAVERVKKGCEGVKHSDSWKELKRILMVILGIAFVIVGFVFLTIHWAGAAGFAASGSLLIKKGLD